MNELLQKWLDIKNVERAMKEQREDIEAQIYMMVKDDLPSDGQKSFEYGSHKLTVKQNISVSVDQEMAAKRPELFKVKYDLSYSQYKKSTDQDFLDNVITIKPTKPTFTVAGVE